MYRVFDVVTFSRRVHSEDAFFMCVLSSKVVNKDRTWALPIHKAKTFTWSPGERLQLIRGQLETQNLLQLDFFFWVYGFFLQVADSDAARSSHQSQRWPLLPSMQSGEALFSWGSTSTASSLFMVTNATELSRSFTVWNVRGQRSKPDFLPGLHWHHYQLFRQHCDFDQIWYFERTSAVDNPWHLKPNCFKHARGKQQRRDELEKNVPWLYPVQNALIDMTHYCFSLNISSDIVGVRSCHIHLFLQFLNIHIPFDENRKHTFTWVSLASHMWGCSVSTQLLLSAYMGLSLPPEMTLYRNRFFLLPLLLVWASDSGFWTTIIKFLLQLQWYLPR